MVFEKPSLRTRVSFEVAMKQLGGDAMRIGPDEVGLGKRESVADVARVLAVYTQGIMARVFDHEYVVELAKWADTMETIEDIHMLLYKAYFVDNVNLSNHDVLIAIAEKAGLSVEGAREVLAKRTMTQKIDQDWKLSREMGITGVPTFVIGKDSVVGFQPYEVLDRMMKKAM